MKVEIKIPQVGESVTEATIGQWLKKNGEMVKRNEAVLSLETDKASVEVASDGDGGILSAAAHHAREDADGPEYVALRAGTSKDLLPGKGIGRDRDPQVVLASEGLYRHLLHIPVVVEQLGLHIKGFGSNHGDIIDLAFLKTDMCKDK